MAEPGTNASGGDPGNAGNPGNGGGSPAGGANPNGAAAASTDWASGLQDEGNRKLVEAKGWSGKPLDTVFSSYSELESKIGKAVVPPGPESTPEQRDAFAKAIGRPAAPDGYTFKMPENLPSDLPYDEVSATKFKNWSHKAGIAPWQAQMLHDEFVNDFAGQRKLTGEERLKAVGAAHEAIVKEWGASDGETYKRNLELANRTLRKDGLLETYKRLGILTDKGEITEPSVAFHLAKVGAAMYSEDNLHGGPESLENPWKEGKENLTEQAAILRRDPNLAETLIRAAGKDPAKELWRRPTRQN
jgi:hypothetical protein